LLAFRQDAELLQSDVAHVLGLESTDRISHWEKGQSFPSIVNLFKLAHLYGVTPDVLYPKQYWEAKNAVRLRKQ
jgi:transcriptional regulator with XRE-family HTH domain